MSPRGVTTPNPRERLFAAAERVLKREGPAGLTSRAITTEADCAKGLLHAHFASLDEFVADLVLDRFAHTARQAEQLPDRAGQSTLAANLRTVALALLAEAGPTIAGLAMARPAASMRIRQAWEADAPGFTAIQKSIADYLTAEKALRRLSAAADCDALALALTATVHHLLMTSWAGAPDPGPQVERVIATLVGGTGVPV
ncbi:AcrR family transcriptional regulator [Streptacidiphilus sp. MAP12-16]|uniref:TetR/AcrR family transcriptional regulator n=1 Tax=Streptacidiphilus sp. MAP12-16 TaxID=3156300 RepID=UPI003510F625